MPISINSVLHMVANDIIQAAASPEPLEQITTVLRDYTNRFHAQETLVHEEVDDEVLLHASEKLTIYHITLSPGLQYPPHDHLMDALIGIYKGSETNFIYPLDGVRLGLPEGQDVAAPAVVHLPPQTVHSVANAGGARSGALHVYLGDLTRIHRHMWRLDGGHAEPFDNDRYLAGARPI